jgi:tryptophanyl-tRNA synthetase
MSGKTVFSGIQPSGELSLGNYLGALKRFKAFQGDSDSLFCVVDLHAITVRQDPAQLRQRTYSGVAWYIASGLDPQQCTLFAQSHVSAHAELAWVLNTFTQMGELERMTQFKDKAARHKHNINAGLFAYPALMAADILLYDTHEVPVGDDQKQHIELARDVAERFNGVYGPTFVVPKMVPPKAAARVMDLQDPTSKMSKSVDSLGTVFLHEDAAAITKKIKRAVTDNEGCITLNKDKQPGVYNLLAIYAACHDQTPEQALAVFEGKGYGDLKGAVAEAVVSTLAPVQAEHKKLMADTTQLDAVLADGAAKARARADKKLAEVYAKVGFTPRR